MFKNRAGQLWDTPGHDGEGVSGPPTANPDRTSVKLAHPNRDTPATPHCGSLMNPGKTILPVATLAGQTVT
jgi:hypothetical protein